MAVLALVVVQALAKSPWGVFTIATTIPVAFIMGIGLRTGKVSVAWITAFGLPDSPSPFGAGNFLVHYPALEDWFRQDEKWLAWALMIYGLAASILPVWMLLTPRDYLEHVFETGNRRGAWRWRSSCCDPTLLMPSMSRFIDGTGPVFAGPVFPVCVHHDRLRRGFRISLVDRVRDDAENGRARGAHSQHRIRRDGDGNDGCA